MRVPGCSRRGEYIGCDSSTEAAGNQAQRQHQEGQDPRDSHLEVKEEV